VTIELENEVLEPGLPEPQDCDKKLRNISGFRAQFERFAENKHYFRDSSKNQKNQGAVEAAKSDL
jgi:hypothetical protein